ncbi:TetR/AcrR family transcriptional regulator [Salidesulfovibrio onnuriiensis]|uniref:TetR/AcrR family transcriptional regulator n=1 Tax=Salidesulfovibrio onnuriiensis TaxID=2583823 RepID=UPI0016505235|nr:TetR/AcrR family transcriptional regulator [Salidesulfovibrio onnuriiensis]
MEGSASKRDLVLRSALRLISEHGFHNTPMSQVARESGVAVGTIYHHFSGKEALINELYREVKLFIMGRIAEGFDPAMPVERGIRLVWRNYLDFRLTHPVEMRFAEQYKNSPYIERETIEALSAMNEPFNAFLRRGIDEGVLEDRSPVVIMAALFGPVDSLSHLCTWFGAELSEELAAQTEEACWQAIRKQ